MSIAAIAPIGAIAAPQVFSITNPQGPAQTTAASFADMLTNGIAKTESKVAEADRLVTQFATDDSVPLHRVTYALEEARLSFELMLQIRNRLLEGTQQLMNMQL